MCPGCGCRRLLCLAPLLLLPTHLLVFAPREVLLQVQPQELLLVLLVVVVVVVGVVVVVVGVVVVSKQNGKFSYLEAFCFILPRLVSKKRANVTKQNILGEARAINAMQPHGRGQPRGRGKGKGGADTGTPNPQQAATPGNGGNERTNPRQYETRVQQVWYDKGY